MGMDMNNNEAFDENEDLVYDFSTQDDEPPSFFMVLDNDMNDENDLDVLDVVLLVQEILDGGMGDVGDLINIVRG